MLTLREAGKVDVILVAPQRLAVRGILDLVQRDPTCREPVSLHHMPSVFAALSFAMPLTR